MVSEPVLLPLETTGTSWELFSEHPLPTQLAAQGLHLLGTIFRHAEGDLGSLAAVCGWLRTREGVISRS